MSLLFKEFQETLPNLLADIENLQNQLKLTNDTLIEIKANKKSIEAKIAKKLDECVKLNKLTN